jgi:predicted RNA-binding protein associated with RNAse of E/G family
MDSFQINAISQKLDSGDVFHESFALMGYLKQNNRFVKRFGYMLISAQFKSDKWHIYFLFQDHQDNPNCWVSDVVEVTKEEENVTSICEVIAHIENYSFKTFHNGKILGLHKMSVESERDVKLNSILSK